MHSKINKIRAKFKIVCIQVTSASTHLAIVHTLQMQ